MAFSVTATLKVNGGNGPVSVKIGSKATNVGKAHYDATFHGVPLPSTGYLVHSVAYVPFKRPVITSTNQPIKAFTIDTNPVTGASGWNYRNNFTVWDYSDANMTSTAVAELTTGSKTYYNTHGSGKASLTNGNDAVQVKVVK